MHCGRFIPRPMTRREMLRRCASGFGAVAFAALAAQEALRATPTTSNPLAPKPPHFPAKATSVIFLYMDGGPSQVDTFDPKPLLDQLHGQPMPLPVQPTQFNDVGRIMRSPWRFRN